MNSGAITNKGTGRFPKTGKIVKSRKTCTDLFNINHVFRVVKIAKKLSEIENAKLEVVVPAAYLHDCFFPS
jgi:HD superfamily phosphodiesterase